MKGIAARAKSSDGGGGRLREEEGRELDGRQRGREGVMAEDGGDAEETVAKAEVRPRNTTSALLKGLVGRPGGTPSTRASRASGGQGDGGSGMR